MATKASKLFGLSDYLTDYIGEQEKKNQAKDYEKWLSEEGVDTAARYGESRAAASTALAAAAPGYGKSGEALAAAGLSGSGYASYLGETAERAYSDAGTAAKEERTAGVAANREGYRQYLADWGEAQDTKMRSTLSKMLSGGFESYDEAYRYAVTQGLASDRAQVVSEMTLAAGNDRSTSATARIKILSNILMSGMDYETAYLYARACGMSVDLASTVGELARRARENRGQGAAWEAGDAASLLDTLN